MTDGTTAPTEAVAAARNNQAGQMPYTVAIIARGSMLRVFGDALFFSSLFCVVRPFYFLRTVHSPSPPLDLTQTRGGGTKQALLPPHHYATRAFI